MSALFQIMAAVQNNSGDWVFLPETTKITPDVAPDEMTTMTISHRLGAAGSELLQPGSLVRVYYRKADGFWASPRNGTYRLAHTGEDKVKRDEVTWTARSLFGDFERAVLLQAPGFVAPVRDLGEFDQHYPRTWPDGSSVGDVLAVAIQESKARGELSQLDTSLVSVTHDSAGNPWSKELPPEEQNPFTSLSSLVTSLTERGLVSVQFDDMQLLLLDPATIGVDRSKDVELMPSRDITEAPSRRESDAFANRAYVKGDNAICEIVDAVDINPLDVRAVTVDASGVTDRAVLRRIGLLHLVEVNKQRFELTIGLDCWASKYVPWRDFDVDDLVTVAYGGGGSGVHRVQQITIDQDDRGVRASVVLGDRLPDPDVETLKQLKSMRESGTRGLGATGVLQHPASAIRPGTSMTMPWGPDGGFKVTPDGFEMKDKLGNNMMSGGPDGWTKTPAADLSDASLVYVVDNGASTTTPRPNVNGRVYWVGSAIPANAAVGDIHRRVS